MNPSNPAARTTKWLDAVSKMITPDELFCVAIALIKLKTPKEKLAGIALYERKLLKKRSKHWRSDLRLFSRLFEDGFIDSWSVTDAFCTRILGKLISTFGTACAGEIGRWSSSKNIWKRRASVVAFVNLVQKDQHCRRLAVKNAIQLIESKDMLHQTAVGWVMCEMGKVHRADFKRFVKTNRSRFTSEGLAYAMGRRPTR